MKNQLTYSFFLLLALCAVACGKGPDYTAKIDAIDAALLRVDSAAQVFATVSQEEGSALNAAINRDVKRVADHFATDMDKQTGMILSQYKSTANIVKDWKNRHRRVTKEIDRTNHQLNGLKAALEMGATQDSMGNAFTPEFIERQFTQEITVADHLVDEIGEMEDRLERAKAVYATMQPQIQPILDRLPESSSEQAP